MNIAESTHIEAKSDTTENPTINKDSGGEKLGRIKPRRRVMLQLLFFVVGCLLLISLQGGFSFLLIEKDRKLDNQKAMIQLSEQLIKELLAAEKDSYLLANHQFPLTSKTYQAQLHLRADISNRISHIKTIFGVMQWGGKYTSHSAIANSPDPEGKALYYELDEQHQDLLEKLLELKPHILQVEVEIAHLSLLSLRNNPTTFESNTKSEQIGIKRQTHLSHLQTWFVQINQGVEYILQQLLQQLEAMQEQRNQQELIQLILYPLFAAVVIVVIIAIGIRMVRQMEVEDNRLQTLFKELESARESEREVSKAKANFLSTISHEILTPINAVIGLVSLLLNSQLNKEQYRYAKSIKDSGDQLLTIVNEIQDFYKLDSGQFTFDHLDFDLQTLIESIYEIISARAMQKKLRVGYFIESEVKAVFRGDPAKIRQVLVNLLNNAIKFTPNGGLVLEVSAVVREDQEWVRFEVRDSGIGISEQALPELFDSFTQVDNRLSRDYGGIGLGLAISKHIVELMGGTIGVNSCSNQGSTFWFELPLERVGTGQLHHHIPERQSETENFDQQEVLYIDELEINRKLTLKKMRHWNLQAIAKESTADGFKELWKNKVNGKSNYVLLIDLAAENDEKSIDFVHQVKAETSFKTIPVIFTTSLSFKKIELSLPNYRQERITPLVKPYRNDQLHMALNNAFTQIHTQDGHYPIVDQYLQDLKHKQSEQQEKSLKVLVVDDNSINQMVAKGYLSKKGHKIVCAENGKQAVDMVKQQHFDLILMDLQMPVMDGITATRMIRELPEGDKNSIPIVAMTANALAEERKNCYAAGMNDFLSKPIDKTMLEVVLAGNFETPRGKVIH